MYIGGSHSAVRTITVFIYAYMYIGYTYLHICIHDIHIHTCMYVGGSHSAVRAITVFDIRASGGWIPVSGVCVCVCV